MNIINSRMHGAIDYGVVLFLWLSPWLFGLAPTTSKFTYALGAIHLLLTVLTNFEMGLFKVIPFRVHGLIEFVVSIALMGLAFYLGNIEGDLSRYYYLSFGIAVLLTWLLTNYKTSTK